MAVEFLTLSNRVRETPPGIRIVLRTPFYKYHVEHGAKFVEFAGWEMPIMYGSIRDEHVQVRSSGGMFDVSHMGRLTFKGRDAALVLERMCSRRVHDMTEGRCRYSLVCNERGGVRDDVLIYRYGAEDFMLVVNAANRAKIIEHIESLRGDFKFDMKDTTEKTGMIAMQGPRVMGLIANFSEEVPALKNYTFCVKSMIVFKMTISRTGYTGEDGVEVIMPANMAGQLVSLMTDKGGDEAKQIIRPAGLGARDSLRLEAGMPLYGHEMDEQTDPISAGLMFGINLDKDEGGPGIGFVGQEALKKIAADGPRNKLVGLKIDSPRTARQGADVLSGGAKVGRITSGCLSPTLGCSIAMGYVPSQMSEVGNVVQVAVGSGSSADAEVVKLPFYKRAKK